LTPFVDVELDRHAARQFFEHPQTVERRLGGVVEYMQLDEVNRKIVLSLNDINI
jgi:hypothetical protein